MQQALILLSAIWFMVLAGTFLLLYHYSCTWLVQQVQAGEAPRTVPMTVFSQPRPSAHNGATSPGFSAASIVVRNPDIVPGTLVKGYLVHTLLGAGGFARVYLAEHRLTGQLVALKVFDGHKAWRHERRMYARVTHHAFPRLLGAFHSGQGYCLALEYVPGVDLDLALEERGVLSLSEALELGVQLAEALGYLHSFRKPIIHRDVKPGNVRLKADRSAWLLDLGIAQRGKRPGPFNGWGTPEYMAPEALAGQPCLASDIYALGMLLWEALAGQPPDTGKGIYPFLPAPELPGLSALLRSMVARKAALRPCAATVMVELSWLGCLAEARVAA